MLLLQLATSYVGNQTAQTVIVSISVGIVAIEFIGIIVYHILLRVGKQITIAQIMNAIANVKKKDQPVERDPNSKSSNVKPAHAMAEAILLVPVQNFTELREPLLD